jgi:malonate-semialdehyde dehydrogenase (acetylating)/methylmalonate-semialdehyde dehydrogenase
MTEFRTYGGPGDRVENYVDGEWRAVDDAEAQPVVNPATGRTLAELPLCGEAAVDDAVAAGRRAFAEWRRTPVEERVQPLFRLKTLLEEHRDELAELLVAEHGKTTAEATGELRRGIENVEVACGIPSLMQAGHLQNAAPGIDETAVRRPLGVFAAVTPFNFPGMIPLWFLPYAVATGNAFVLKPSERTPLTAIRLFELLDRAGFPPGVLGLVHGGPDAADAILEHDGIEGVSFVGSTPVARHVYETAAAHGKRVQAQGGAKNHVVVAPSADLAFAAEGTVGSAFANSGQRCLANPVAVVVDEVYDAFVDRLVAATDDLVVGPGDAEGTDMGPLHGEAHAERVRGYVEDAAAAGVTLLRDGRGDGPDDAEVGTYVGPTVFGDVEPGTPLATDEIFGPVLAVIRAEDLGDAIDVVNASRYGNAASLFTARGADARRFRHDVDAGNLGVNVGTAAPMAFFHFGGSKESFFGDLHAQSEDVVRFYTDEAVYIERWPDADGDGD